MPYKSKAQQGYFHAQKGKKVPADVVEEFDKASRGQHGLPKHVKKGKAHSKSMKSSGKKASCGDCPISFA